jgi:tetratricopeptide (TPR) repeat protein
MAERQQKGLGKRILLERDSRHWTQETLAEKIGGSVPSINRWEHDRSVPRQDMIDALTEVFGKPPEAWGSGKKRFWNIPFLRNPYFTNRETVLVRLHNALGADRTRIKSERRALSGLGGIGKTQTALEYAHRYADEYEAVLWVQAASREVLAEDFANLALTLEVWEETKGIDHARMTTAVKGWLAEHTPWLLIFDNADDPTLVPNFLPSEPGGAVLLTTHSQDSSQYIINIPMEKMGQDEAVIFLLSRSTPDKGEDGEKDLFMNAPESERAAAQKLWEIMDGLPLALDQAGAYAQTNQFSLAEYEEEYRHRRKELLQDRSGKILEHPTAVATTWDISFQQVEQKNPAAADLLRFMAFLAPDAIPEELFSRGTARLPASLQELATPRVLRDAIKTLSNYSLVRRDTVAHTLFIHRLVQAVLRDAMSAEIKQQWKEHVVRALADAFPEPPFLEWKLCRSLMPHAQDCATWIEHEQVSLQLEAASLFHKAGAFLREQGQYFEAEPMLTLALSIRTQRLGADHLDTATSMSNLAGLYAYQGKFSEAEALVTQALSIRQQHLGMEHPDTATNLGNLATLYVLWGQYEQAEALFQEVLTIMGDDHREYAKNLNNLVVLYMQQEKFDLAEPLLQRAIEINEQRLGKDRSETARYLGNLADIYRLQKDYDRAEPLYQHALAIYKQNAVPEGPEITAPLFGLAELYRHRQNYKQALPLYQRVLSIREQNLEPDHPEMKEAVQGLMTLYRDMGKEDEASLLSQRIYKQPPAPS